MGSDALALRLADGAESRSSTSSTEWAYPRALRPRRAHPRPRYLDHAWASTVHRRFGCCPPTPWLHALHLIEISCLLIRDDPLGKAHVLGADPVEGGHGYGVQGCIAGAQAERSRRFATAITVRGAVPLTHRPELNAGRTESSAPQCGHARTTVCCRTGASSNPTEDIVADCAAKPGTNLHRHQPCRRRCGSRLVHLIANGEAWDFLDRAGAPSRGHSSRRGWTMKHKIMALMARLEADTPLSGPVVMDDAYHDGTTAPAASGSVVRAGQSVRGWRTVSCIS